jgi:flagellin-like protein
LLSKIFSREKRGAFLRVDDELKEFSKEKKAMSPLIATMLLIAFAVALGAMIMNWSSTLGEGAKAGLDCSSITMSISPYLCYAENMIKLSIKNSGSGVESVTLKMIDESGETIKLLPDSKLGSGDTLQKDVRILKTGKAYVALIPNVMHKGEVVPCPDPAIELDDIPSC